MKAKVAGLKTYAAKHTSVIICNRKSCTKTNLVVYRILSIDYQKKILAQRVELLRQPWILPVLRRALFIPCLAPFFALIGHVVQQRSISS